MTARIDFKKQFDDIRPYGFSSETYSCIRSMIIHNVNHNNYNKIHREQLSNPNKRMDFHYIVMNILIQDRIK